MKLFYGWVIVGVGFVCHLHRLARCCRLASFLQPMSAAMAGHARISMAALLSFLSWVRDRYCGARCRSVRGNAVVVLCGGRVLLGAGLVSASQAARSPVSAISRPSRVQGSAAGSFYSPLTAVDDTLVHEHPGSPSRCVLLRTGIGSLTIRRRSPSGLIDSHCGGPPWRVLGGIAWLVVISAALSAEKPPAMHESRRSGKPRGRRLDRGRALRTPQFAAIARPSCVLRGACPRILSFTRVKTISGEANCGAFPRAKCAAATVVRGQRAGARAGAGQRGTLFGSVGG